MVQDIDTTYIQPNILFFSKLLRIHTQSIVPATYQYHANREINQRDLELQFFPGPEQNYSIMAVEYRYVFDYYSPKTIYTEYQTAIINGKLCECKRVYGNGYYIFRTIYERQSLFHFTFHEPTPLIPKRQKFKGAFHLIVDSMEVNRRVPYRPFIIGPAETFYVFQDFNVGGQLINLFTTPNPIFQTDEITPFVTQLQHTTPVQNLIQRVNRKRIHYLDDIIGPIYDKIANDMLTPMSRLFMGGVTVPIPVQYNPLHQWVNCNTNVSYPKTPIIPGGRRLPAFHSGQGPKVPHPGRSPIVWGKPVKDYVSLRPSLGKTKRNRRMRRKSMKHILHTK
jgi:hypothetical protein